MGLLRLFKKTVSDSAVSSKKELKTPIKDPLIGKLLNELKLATLKIDSAVKDSHLNYELHQSYLTQYYIFCSQIEDSLEIFDPGTTQENVKKKSVDLSNVAKDFAEVYGNRYGKLIASKISLLVSNSLPLVKANPGEIIRLIDTVARSSYIRSTESDLQVSLKHSFNENNYINLKFENIFFATELNRTKELVNEFMSGCYTNALSILGVELCAALHIFTRLKATVEISKNAQGVISLEASIPVELAETGDFPANQWPESFYAYTKSEHLKKILTNIAESEKQKVHFTTALSKVPKKFSLVYDATDLNENTLVELSKVESPEKTVIILPAYDLEKMQALRRMGFNYFLCFPLVSSQLFYSIRQSSFTKFGTSEETLKSLNQRKLKVLIVDDSVTSRIVLRDFLEAMGHQVVEGSDGHELVKFIEAGQKFDIVFCDQTMPHMDGITALTKMREFEEKEGCATPVVLITAYDEIDEELKEHSFNSVLKKPVNTSEVERAINEFVYKESKIESVAPVVKAETKIIDLEDLRSRCNGKTKTMVRVLESFIATTRIELVNLKNEDTVKNPELLKRKLHTIKGLLREAGAIEVAESVRLMEEKVQSNTALEDTDISTLCLMISEACDNANEVKENLQ